MTRINRNTNSRKRGKLKEKVLFGVHSRRKRSVPRLLASYERKRKMFGQLNNEILEEGLTRIPGSQIRFKEDKLTGDIKLNLRIPSSTKIETVEKAFRYLNARTLRLNRVGLEVEQAQERIITEANLNSGEQRSAAERALNEIKRLEIIYSDESKYKLQAVMQVLIDWIAEHKSPVRFPVEGFR